MATKSKQQNKFNLENLKSKSAAPNAPITGLWYKASFAFLIGLILALSSPGLDQWWLAWFMVAPFLVLLTFCQGPVEAIFCGLFFGLGYHVITLRFYFGLTQITQNNTGLGWQLCGLIWFIQALALSLPTVAFAWLACSLPLRPGYIPYFKRPFFPYLLSLPLLWIFTHWGLSVAGPLMKIWQLAPLPPVPIDQLCYSQYSQLPILQIGKYIGPAGIEFLLVLVNTAVAALSIEFVKTQNRPVERVDLISPRLGSIIDLTVALAITVVIFYWGESEISRLTYGSDKKIESNIEINQPLIPTAVLSSDVLSQSKLSSSIIFKSLSQALQNFSLIIMPEPKEEISSDQMNNIWNSLKAVGHQDQNDILISFISNHGMKQNAEWTRHTIICTPTGALNIQQYFDYPVGYSLFHQQASIKNLAATIPLSLKEWFFLKNNNDLQNSIAKTRWGRLAILGTSDLVDPRLVAKKVRDGASLLISQADLSWTYYKGLNKQYLTLAIFRAIENNRYFVVCNREKVLAIIEPSGAIQSLFLNYKEKNVQNNQINEITKPAVITGAVQFLWSKTPFTKMWWL